MTKKIQSSVLVLMTLFGLFAVAVPQNASAMTCNSATLTGNVITGTPPARARFEYSTSQSAVSNGQGITTPVQTFYSDGPIQQFVSGLTESTNYYYRLAVTNNYGTIYTTLSSFTTPACPVNSPTPTVNISADSTNLSYNGSTTVRWNSTDATSCSASGGTNGWSGNKTLSGSFSTGNLTGNTTFHISCSNSSGSDNDSVTINVGSAPLPIPTVSISANPSSVAYNGTSTISWNSTNATSCSASGGTNGWSGNKTLSGTFSLSNLTNNTTFSITCTNNSGSASDSVTISVGSAPVNNPTVNLTADQSNVAYNGSTTIRWSSTNSASCSASGGTNGWSGAKALSGAFFTGNLTNTTTYTITCYSSQTGTSATDSVTVVVGNQPVLSPTVNLSADNSNVAYNGSTTIRWNSNNATYCSASGGTNGWSGPKALSGSFFTGSLTNATTFHINCSNSSGSDSASVTVSVGSQQINLPSVTISASPSNVSYNGTSIINWSSTDATSCTASGGTSGWSGTKALYGSFYTGPMTNTKTFYITCNNNAGSDNASVTVTVGNQQIIQPSVTIYADDTDIDEDDSTTVHWNSNNADSCTATGGANGWSGPKALSGSFFTGSLSSDKTFYITCSNNQGSDSDSVTINVDEDNGSSGDVSVDITADDTSIDEGDSTKIRWDSDNADDCETIGGTSEWSRKNIGTSGSFSTGDLDDDETFKIECTNDDGDSDTDSVTVRVSGDRNNDRPSVDINADRTTVNSGQGTTVRWDVDDADDCYASGGTNGWSGYKSTSGGSFYTGAMYGTATFFLDCGNDEGNESDSVTIQVVSTPVPPPQTVYVPTPAPAPIIRNTTTYISSGTAKPLVELTIDGGDDSIGPNESRIYQVEWKNISGQTLRKVALRIVLPESMTFENTNRGSYTSKDNTITLDIDELRPSETGDMLFTGRTKSNLRNNQLVVVVANIVYTDKSDTQGDVVAYATHHADLSGLVLGANAFYAGFFPDTLLGWLFFLILLLILLLLVRYLYGQSNPRHVMVTDNIHHH